MRHFIAIVFLAHGLAFGLLSMQAVSRGYADQVLPLSVGSAVCLVLAFLVGGPRKDMWRWVSKMR